MRNSGSALYEVLTCRSESSQIVVSAVQRCRLNWLNTLFNLNLIWREKGGMNRKGRMKKTFLWLREQGKERWGWREESRSHRMTDAHTHTNTRQWIFHLLDMDFHYVFFQLSVWPAVCSQALESYTHRDTHILFWSSMLVRTFISQGSYGHEKPGKIIEM